MVLLKEVSAVLVGGRNIWLIRSFNNSCCLVALLCFQQEERKRMKEEIERRRAEAAEKKKQMGEEAAKPDFSISPKGSSKVRFGENNC